VTAVGLAFDQRHAEPLFQQMHHPAHRRGETLQLAAAAAKLRCAPPASKPLMQ